MKYVYVIVNSRGNMIAGPMYTLTEAEQCIPPSSKNLRVKTFSLEEYARRKGQEREYQIKREFSINNKNN